MSTRRQGAPSDVPLKPGRGRRPTEDVRRAALAAAGELLLEEGMGAMTFAKIATRAGVSKMTLYKWWPSPGSLAYEAYAHVLEEPLAFPQTGDIRADLATQLHAFVKHLRRNGKVVAELVGTAQGDPPLAEALSQRYVKHRRELAIERMKVAQASGEIRSDVDLEAVVDQIWGACYHRLLLSGLPVTPAFADALLENVFAGIGEVPGR